MLGVVVEVMSSTPAVGHKNIFQHFPAKLIYYISPYIYNKTGISNIFPMHFGEEGRNFKVFMMKL